MAQEEIMHVPMVVNHHRHHHVEQANLFRSTDICFEHIVEVPVSRAQEEIVHVPAVVNDHRHHHVEQKMIVDFHVPPEKEEIVVPTVVNHRRHHFEQE